MCSKPSVTIVAIQTIGMAIGLKKFLFSGCALFISPPYTACLEFLNLSLTIRTKGRLG